ncbi:aftiphilin isoform X2 [Rhineura floridana]|uniref:aftiphilin isoform X2 n=1 Tax=Rhineura floridana TaxID=261503 RepID=UPI002AC84253|nr:aftiphilin isoform X2 [Rhineura floridana]
MESDIIRMYSSSPPPLDNGAEEEEEEDEFGDFGGFSGAGSTVGFDFASDYSSSKEERKSSYNSDYSGNVDGIIAFTTVAYANNEESVKELPPDSSKEKCEYRNSSLSLDGIHPAEVKRTAKLESSYSEIIRTDMKVLSQDEQVETCNGEKRPCPDVLTNGFAALDTASSQGVEDVDSTGDSKGLKMISTHSSELSLDSFPTAAAEDFADFATFSNKQTTLAEEIGNKICTNSGEREVVHVQESNIINGQGGSMKETTLDSTCEYEGETCTEGEQIYISKINLMISEDFKAEEGCTALEHNDFVSSMQTNLNSVGTTKNMEGKRECDAGSSKENTFLRTNNTTNILNLNVGGVQSLQCLPTEENMYASEVIKNSESGTGHASCSGLNEDDFGEFGSVSNGSLDITQASASQEHFQIPSESIGKQSNGCSDLRDRSGVHQRVFSQPDEISNTDECRKADTGSNMTVQRLAELENGDDSEFGDFGSVAKKFPDSDEFSDFSSAGGNQATEWNAFEAEQKESCLWAAFGDEQVVECHHGKDEWPSHRTGTTFGVEDSVTHTPDNVSVTSLQDLPASARTMLLNRLERIFEACFPSVPSSEMEEEIAPLSLLLETGHKAGRTEETLSERELLDVWTELQDIHDAYGLKYQWGGSHSNKKLLCCLGIDTRNILFTGNRKQPVIVPMYAAGLGMLEPTKEPLKPISAAEKIASIGQTPPVSPEMNICTSDQFQESLPPVQFDWSSSGLTNPLDGVDPELYELTTSKLETSNTTSKVTDAFAKLMSTVEKATTSARKPKKEEQLSEEAAKVISSLPDLSFMHAKVLMFPATLTPSTSCQGKVD